MALSDKEELELLTIEREKAMAAQAPAGPQRLNAWGKPMSPAAVAAVADAKARPFGSGTEHVAYKAGEKVTDLTGSPELGFATNVAAQAVPALLGAGASEAAAPTLVSGARRLMQSALKPDLTSLRTGKAATAIDTMLQEGFNATHGGVEKMKSLIAELNDEITKRLAGSSATVDSKMVASRLRDTLSRFEMQVNPAKDTNAIKSAWDEFLNHPKLAELEQNIPLSARLAEKTSSKASVLQDSGRFATTSAQQEIAANSFHPVPGMPRVPASLTNNAGRIPEANSAYHDALVIARQRQAEKEFIQYQLDALKQAGLVDKSGARIPVQLAQSIKQGTYRAIGDKGYGELKGAEIEAQKALARGLKEEISSAVPSVGPLNAREGTLINAANIAERRALLQDNNNIGGLAWLTHDPVAAAGFIADKSSLLKSILARAMYSGSRTIPGTVGAAAGGILGHASGMPEGDDEGILGRRISWMGSKQHGND